MTKEEIANVIRDYTIEIEELTKLADCRCGNTEPAGLIKIVEAMRQYADRVEEEGPEIEDWGSGPATELTPNQADLIDKITAVDPTDFGKYHAHKEGEER